MNLTIGQTVYFDEYLSKQLHGAEFGRICMFSVHGSIKIMVYGSDIGYIWLDETMKEHLLEQPLGVATEYEPYEYYGNPFGDVPTPDNPIPIEVQLKGKNLLDGTIVELTGKELIYKKYIEGKWEKEMDCKKILNKWADMQRDELKCSYEQQKEKLIENDSIVKEYRDIENYIKATVEQFGEKHLLPKDVLGIVLTDIDRIISEATKEKIKQLKTEFSKKIDTMHKTLSEIEAAISICETEESLRKILKAYGIIDKNGKISVK